MFLCYSDDRHRHTGLSTHSNIFRILLKYSLKIFNLVCGVSRRESIARCGVCQGKLLFCKNEPVTDRGRHPGVVAEDPVDDPAQYLADTSERHQELHAALICGYTRLQNQLYPCTARRQLLHQREMRRNVFVLL